MIPYSNWINFYSNLYGRDPELVKRMMFRESENKPNAVSPAGAYGLMQLMPATAAMLKVDPKNPEENIKGGVKYLQMMQDQYGPVMGLAAYNWGPGNLDKYLAGKKQMPKETEDYLKNLGPYADPNYYHAPMNPQGIAGVMPETVPIQAPTTYSATPQTPEPPQGEQKMDDYEQMKIFNPYIQMALGILAGNSGQNKTEAFANAMQGGLGGLNAAQRSRAYEVQTRAQTDAVRMKQKEYALMQQRAKYEQDWALNKLKSGQYDPSQQDMLELMASGNSDTGIKLQAARQTAADKDFSHRIQLENLDLRREALENKTTGTTLIDIDLPKEHPLYGYKKDQKGNLYDTKGIQQQGSRLNWASDQLSRPANQFVDQKTWENKNNPMRIIPPQEFSNWQNAYGESLQESDFPENVSSNGYKYIPKDQIEKRVISKQHLGELELQMDRLFNKKDGIYSNIKLSNEDSAATRGFESGKNIIRNSGFFTDPVSQNIQKFMAWRKAFLSALTKERGEVGVLTEQDTQRIEGLLVSLTPESFTKPFADSSKLAWDKMKEVYDIFASRGVKNRALEELFVTPGPTPTGITPGGTEYFRE